MTVKHSSDTRRRLQYFATKNEPTIMADRRFFERRPDRQHRLRLASLWEMKESEAMDMRPPVTGFRLFVVVSNVSPGARIRAFFFGPAENAADLDDVGEEEAVFLFERCCQRNARLSEIVRTVEAAMQKGPA
ncbi:hypothetical protein [Xanthobacter autotrophicus]|uniref:hypothetical protein n=1 Tax=Xanthobacter autotrophicus TaxID=280 RepID=UPI0024A637BB|nr:hypothetical protein [Xanthobacter autotrophicus]MDI4657242.1 hypothetical protein [Xanthobacter autotrophicus]